MGRRTLSLAAAAALLASGCSGSGDTSTTTGASTTVPATTATAPTTTTGTSADLLVGTWRTIDADGYEIALTIAPHPDSGYSFSHSEGHASPCEAFGVPTVFVAEGRGMATADGAELNASASHCVTDWGNVPVDIDLTVAVALDGDALTDGFGNCYVRGAAEACGGETIEPIAALPPDVRALIDQFGEEWVRDNYTGDPNDLAGWLDRCAVPSVDAGAWEATEVEMGDLPRHIACGPGGIWVYQRLSNGSVLLDDNLAVLREFDNVGEPRGNADLVVFHTFNTVDFISGDATTPPTRLAEYPNDDFVRDAVPVGADRVLISTSGLTLMELDGTVVWSIEGDGYWEFVDGGDDYWVASPTGKLARVPKDGSEPTVIDVPDAVWSGAENLRPTPNLAPVEGGVWVTNADETVQLFTDSGERGTAIDTGPPPSGDGTHVVPVKPLAVVDGWVYTQDADGVGWRFPADGSAEATRVDGSAPVTTGAGLVWYFEPPGVVARDSAGNIVHSFEVSAGGEHWQWIDGALTITIQGGVNRAPGRVISIRPVG